MTSLAWILAQTSNPANPGTGTAPSGDPFGPMIGIMLAIGVFYFFLLRGQRKDRKKVQTMLDNLKANDRVQTIGGMFGRVVRVRDDQVQLQVDENSNVRVWFNRAAIKDVVTAGTGEAESKG